MVSLRILELIKEETGPGETVIHSTIHWSLLGQNGMRGEVSSRKRLSKDSGKRNHLEGEVGTRVTLTHTHLSCPHSPALSRPPHSCNASKMLQEQTHG